MKHNVGWVFVICVSDFYGFRWGVSGSRQHIRQMLARQHVVCLEALTEPSRCLRVVVGKRMSKAHVFVMPKVLGFQETQEAKFLTQCTFWYRHVYIYIYIYILDPHMTPDGACGVAQSTAQSNADFKAERFRKGFRNSKGTPQETRKCCRIQRRLFEPRLRALTLGRLCECCRTRKGVLERWFRVPSGFAARPSSHFERPVATEHGRAVISSAKHALCGVFECCRRG